MPKAHHHKKHGHKRAHGAHGHAAVHGKRAHSHRTKRRHRDAKQEPLGSFPDALRTKLDRPVTVKTLKDIVALRRVQRGG
jgi:hypothetical protein